MRALLAWVLAAAAVQAQAAPRIEEVKLQAAGQAWTYQLYVPANAKVPAPLVLVFHGAGGNGRLYLERNGWQALADSAGVVVAAPDGLPIAIRQPASYAANPRVWNSGEVPARLPRAQVDDVAFVKAMLDDVAARTSIDRQRVYATGHSNGAGMTYRLALRLPDTFAAVATVMGQNSEREGKLAHGVPTLALLGTADPLFPEAGGERSLRGKISTVPSHAESLAAWAQIMGCGAAVIERDDADLRIENFAGCRDAVPFTAWHIKGQGHGWPGGRESLLGLSQMGPQTGKVDATRTVWEFFAPRRLGAAP